jgi:subtilisin family serine protease
MSAGGTVFVAAAGNDGASAQASFPAAFEEVIAVTAVDENANFYGNATRGHYIDVAAPGVEVRTAVPGKGSGTQTGTSFAVPYVTAIVAAIYTDAGVRAGGAPEAAKTTVLNRVQTKDLGVQGRDPIYGRGLVIAPAACGQSNKVSGWEASLEKVRPEAASIGNWQSAISRTSMPAAGEK